MLPPIGGKSILRSTGEVVEIIDAEIKLRGARSDEDWVTYIDSGGKEHIREKLNVQLDFRTEMNDTLQKMMEFAMPHKIPSERSKRVYETARDLFVSHDYVPEKAAAIARKLVDAIEAETE